MSGLKVEAIAAIRTNLDDRYKDELAILKELIQNADDAGASCLHIGWVAKLPQANHPLLNCPAIFVLNDGEFKANDAEAIQWMGLNSKSADTNSIGKFGYGLKSIFHLCEAFFYLASGEKEIIFGDDIIRRRDILSPWFKEHPKYPKKEWDNFYGNNEAQKDIENCLLTLIEDELVSSKPWFCLWIPLRQKSHYNNGTWYPIIDKYPGDDPLLPKLLNTAEREIELANTLTLLTNLTTIKLWKKEQVNSNFELLFGLQVKAVSRRRRLDTIPKNRLLDIGGSTFVEVGSTTRREIVFNGYETCLDINVKEFQEKEGWPQIISSDPDTGEHKQIKAKAVPHCAVCFSTNPNASKKKDVSISYAAFLPLQERESVVGVNESKYSVLLHGYFFVDAGRTDVKLTKSSNLGVPDIKTEWNIKLLREGILPLLLPALKEFVKNANLTADEIKLLSDKLKRSKLFEDNEDAIYSKSQWVYCLTLDGGKWQLLDKEVTFYELPTAEQTDLHYQVFPGLQRLINITDKAFFTFAKWPNLHPKKPDNWPIRLLNELFSSINPTKLFSNKVQLKYLNTFLTDFLEEEYTSEVSEHFLRIIKTALLTIPIVDLKAYFDLFIEFLEFVPKEKCLFIKLEDDQILKKLLELDLKLLLIPSLFLAKDSQEKTDRQKLPVSDIKDILEQLEQLIKVGDNKHLKIVDSLVVEFIRLVDEQDKLWQVCNKVKVFVGTDYFNKKRDYFSYQELLTMKFQKTLFRESGITTYSHKLQQVLLEKFVVELTENLAKTLFNSEIQICSLETCLLAIKTKPKLVDNIEPRANLLTDLLHNLNNNLGSENKKALRYLLHNNSGSYESNEKLIIEETSPLGKIVTKVMQNDRWKLISKSIADRISDENRGLLDILPITDPIITTILIHKFTPEICSQISPILDNEEINLLLRNDSNEQLWKKLPIHRNQKGELTQITPKTYLRTNLNINLDEAIYDSVIVIDKHTDTKIAHNQTNWIQELDAVSTIKLCLQNNPTKHYKTILEALHYICNYAPLELNEGLIVSLKKEEWLPTKDGNHIKSENIVYIKGLEPEIDRIILTNVSEYLTPSQLKDNVWPEFENSLSKIFPQDKDAIEILGKIMAKDHRYYIGKLEITTESDLLEFFTVFKNAPGDVAVTWPILESLSKQITLDNIILLVNNHISKNISCEKIYKILNYISKCEMESAKSLSQTYLRIHSRYLKYLTEHSDFNISHLSQIVLLNKAKEWSSPDRLCIGEPGIADEYLLDDFQEIVIKGCIKTNKNLLENSQIKHADTSNIEIINKEDTYLFDESVNKLEEYFKDWGKYIAREIIGGFLCFLSDYPKMRELVRSYLGNLSITTRLEHVKATWETPKQPLKLKGLGSTEFGNFEQYQQIEDALKRNRFTVELVNEDKTVMVSLTGKNFEAEIEKDASQLFIGNPEIIKKVRDYRTCRIRLRKLQLETIKNKRGANALSQILLKSTEVIFSTVYEQKNSRLNNSLQFIWSELENSEQLDIQVAQNLLLDSAFFYLSQLGMSQLEHLKAIYQRWQSNRYRIGEYTSINNRQSNPSLSKEKNDIVNELKELITKNCDVQSNLISAIQRKLRDNQYKIDSIPFELFQNADDAAVELEKMGYQAGNKSASLFVISINEKDISFLHWGRRINEFRAGSRFNGQDLGFDRDLEKMLILSSSDKSLGDNNISVTGKFGLGFKSVFLATDSPKVLSGRLNFEVVGGLYPNILTTETFEELRQQLKKYSPSSASANGTIIQLPVTPEDKKQLLERFDKLVIVLLIFARKIRNYQLYNNIQLQDNPQPNKDYKWLEQPFMNQSYVNIGNLQFAEKSIKVLILRTDSCTLLLATGTEGICKLPEDIPTIWVTAPTRETISFGFAINAPFAIDVGRAQLADVAANMKIAYDLGVEIGEALCQIYKAAQENWQDFSRAIGLASSTTDYMFWQSLWELFTDCFKSDKATEDKATKILSLILWGGRNCGMAKLLYKYPVLPNGLFGAYRKLINLNEAHNAITGLLDQNETFLAASEWNSFNENVDIKKIISKTYVHDVFTKIKDVAYSAAAKEKLDGLEGIAHSVFNSINEHRKIDLATLLRKELQNKEINSEQAKRLGKIITKKFLEKAELDEKHVFECKNIQAIIKEAKFQSSRDYKSVQDLLIKDLSSDNNEDEYLRAAFAPEEYLLNSNYKDEALLFFKACRQELQAPAQRLCEWGKKADQKEKQIAFLCYLLNGNRKEQIIQLLKDNLSNWLRELTSWYPQKKYTPISEADFTSILVRLGLIPTTDFIKPHIITPTSFTQNVLENIYTWWKYNQKTYVTKYSESIYPDSYFPRFINSKFNTNSYKERLDWIKLFFLGIMHTMGRTHLEAHRGFLVDQKELVEQFAESSANFQNTFNSIENYINSCPQDIEFYPWIKQFVSYYIISHWLDDYVQSFLDIDKINLLALDIILCPRINSFYQGTGIGDCPPINRVLGIGACYVVRELMRNRIIKNPSAYKYCYVPSSKVRHLLKRIGFDDLEKQKEPPWDTSGRIYQFIESHLQEKSTFDLCFDIPLYYVAKDYDLQKELSGTYLLDDYKEGY